MSTSERTVPERQVGMDAEGLECSGICLSGYDIGLPSVGVAYAHPDCPAHGDMWVPHDNEWSRRYVADHPDRFPSAATGPTPELATTKAASCRHGINRERARCADCDRAGTTTKENSK